MDSEKNTDRVQDKEAAPAAEEKPSEAAPVEKKRRRKFRFAMAAVTLVFAGLAAAGFVLAEKLRDKEQECRMTKLPSGLNAVDTVKQYFRYWDEGNNEGMNQAALPDENRDPTGDDECFNLGLCYFCDIELTRAEQLKEVAEGFEGCYESAVVSVDFTYKTSWGFGDSNMDEVNKNWEFFLAKINKGDDYRIITVERPESR